MNVFVVGIPLKVLLGFLVLLLMLPVYVAFTQNIFAEMFNALDYMFKGFVAVL
jgi:flagellar biosynthetic protein FliR